MNNTIILYPDTAAMFVPPLSRGEKMVLIYTCNIVMIICQCCYCRCAASRYGEITSQVLCFWVFISVCVLFVCVFVSNDTYTLLPMVQHTVAVTHQIHRAMLVKDSVIVLAKRRALYARMQYQTYAIG